MRVRLIYVFLLTAALASMAFFLLLLKKLCGFDDLSIFEHRLDESISRPSQRKIFRYDEAAPRPILGSSRSHHLPNAIPSTRVIPRQYAENKSYHLSQRTNTSKPLSMHPNRAKAVGEASAGQYNWNHSYETDYRTLYLYNPSVLPLHNTIKQDNSRADDPDNLSSEDLAELTGGDPSVRYLATYRAYTGCNCFGPDPKREIMKAGEQISYLAVALLNESLDLIQGSDVLIDLNAGPTRGKYFRQFVEDCRLFALRGGIYFLCNEELMRIKIKRRMTTNKSRAIPAGFGTRDENRIPYVFPNIYGNGLEVTMMGHNGKIDGGKNFNIFRGLAENQESSEKESRFDTGTYDYYLQTFPIPHKFARIEVPNGQDEIKPSLKFHLTEPKLSIMRDAQIIPPPSFDTLDAENPIQRCKVVVVVDGAKTCNDLYMVPFFDDSDHGSACCVEMTLPDTNKKVLVGVSHQKLSPRKEFWKMDLRGKYDDLLHDQFTSRFIAYDAKTFRIVARSGWFCLGFADDAESMPAAGSSLAGKNKEGNARLSLFNETFSCPAIHFISSFSEAVGDDSKAIIGYGVNDCHPRMFMVAKRDISKMLVSG